MTDKELWRSILLFIAACVLVYFVAPILIR